MFKDPFDAICPAEALNDRKGHRKHADIWNKGSGRRPSGLLIQWVTMAVAAGKDELKSRTLRYLRYLPAAGAQQTAKSNP